MQYIYDFENNREHIIVVEEILEHDKRTFPVCLEVEGTSPPEDCGGEGDFNAFLEVMNDSLHPDYNFMKEWTSHQSDHPFNRAIVNAHLELI